MISNRIRIEQQILAGRQAVRMLSRTRHHGALQPQTNLLQLTSQDEKERSNERRNKRPSPISTTPERPISVDTDAEEAFSHGSQWFYKRGRAQRATSPTLDRTKEDPGRDPLSSSRMRRKWALDLLNHTDGLDGETDSNRAPPEKGEGSSLSPTRFFRRLSSFHGIHSPRSSQYNRDTKDTDNASKDEVWSSGSSDEENDEYIYSRNLLNFGVEDGGGPLDEGGMDEL